MKILLIGPYFSSAKHAAEVGVYNALVKMGHETDVWDHRANETIRGGFWGTNFEYNDPNHHYFNEYELILSLGPGLPDKILQSKFFKDLNGKKVLWNSEPIRLQSYRDKLLAQKDVWDVVFSFDESELPIYKEMGIDAKWMPQAYNFDWYKPIDSNQDSTFYDLVFCGSLGGKWNNRVNFLNRVSKSFRLHVVNGCFDAEQVNLIYNKAKLVLNLGLCHEELGPPENLKSFGLQQRIFESIGSGRVCVTNEIPAETNQLFQHKEDILFYNDKNLEEIIEFGLDEANRSRMEDNIKQIRHKHSYLERIKQLLEEV